jgi:hypothetical protein
MFESYWKVKDGLFVGNQDASIDTDFLAENQVSGIVNCAGRSVPNSWETLGIRYITFDWFDNDSQIILEKGSSLVDQVTDFIEITVDRAESVLVHSVYGQSRSVCLIAAYMMKRYKWRLKKVMNFLMFRRLEIQMKPGFIMQLEEMEKSLLAESNLSDSWDPKGCKDDDEAVLRNSYCNAQGELPEPLKLSDSALWEPTKLRWHDKMNNNKALLEKPPGADKNSQRDGKGQLVLKSICKAPSLNRNIVIHTKSGIVRCNPSEIVPKRFGLKLQTRTIILEYVVPEQGLRAHHSISIDLPKNQRGPVESGDVGKEAKSRAVAKVEDLQRMHAPWLSGVSTEQLKRLLGRFSEN